MGCVLALLHLTATCPMTPDQASLDGDVNLTSREGKSRLSGRLRGNSTSPKWPHAGSKWAYKDPTSRRNLDGRLHQSSGKDDHSGRSSQQDHLLPGVSIFREGSRVGVRRTVEIAETLVGSPGWRSAWERPSSRWLHAGRRLPRSLWLLDAIDSDARSVCRYQMQCPTHPARSGHPRLHGLQRQARRRDDELGRKRGPRGEVWAGRGNYAMKLTYQVAAPGNPYYGRHRTHQGRQQRWLHRGARLGRPPAEGAQDHVNESSEKMADRVANARHPAVWPVARDARCTR
jgi:hypothetical protein